MGAAGTISMPTGPLIGFKKRLNGVTWTDRSAAIVVVPEMEEWLWHCPASIARYFGIDAAELDAVMARALISLNLSRERCCREKPKELFETILYARGRRKPLPAD